MADRGGAISERRAIFTHNTDSDKPLAKGLTISLTQIDTVDKQEGDRREVTDDQDNTGEARRTPAALEIDREKHRQRRNEHRQNVVEQKSAAAKADAGQTLRGPA